MQNSHEIGKRVKSETEVGTGGVLLRSSPTGMHTLAVFIQVVQHQRSPPEKVLPPGPVTPKQRARKSCNGRFCAISEGIRNTRQYLILRSWKLIEVAASMDCIPVY